MEKKNNKLIHKLDFHDSCIEEIIHKSDSVIIRIDLCMWRQKNFNSRKDESKEMVLEFCHVEDYLWDSDKAESEIDYDTIIELTYDGENVKIVIVDGCTSVIKFKCYDVFVDANFLGETFCLAFQGYYTK